MRLAAVLLCVPAPVFAFDEIAIQEKCDADWGSDYKMVAYCREQQSSAGESVDDFRKQSEGDPVAATIITHCDGAWGKDYEMIDYCISEQRAAHKELQKPAENVPSDILDTVTTQCAGEWNADFEMISYCRDRQIKAWRSLQ